MSATSSITRKSPLDGDRLTDSGQRIEVKGGPVAVRVADK
jgi:hypothetical protein